MPDTKDLRLVLKRKQDIEAFNTAKDKAERELGYTLRDNEFATRVLVQAVKSQEQITYSASASPKVHISNDEIAAIVKQLKRED